MSNSFRMFREAIRKNHAKPAQALGGPRASGILRRMKADSRHQKKPALMSRPYVASSKATTRPTPQNMATVLRVSTSI
jgi:hypothetical protein